MSRSITLAHSLSRLKGCGGFTLVEVLVALIVMSIMAVVSWQSIDGMARANDASRMRADELAAIQTALQQWKTDVDAMIDPKPAGLFASAGTTASPKAIDFDGRVLRVTRLMPGDEIRVVAWGSHQLAGGVGAQREFKRWVSAPLRTRADWQIAWDRAGRWAQSPSEAERASETMLMKLTDWQVFFYRNDSWSNPLSAGDATESGTAMPDGVRLILRLAPEQLPGGQLLVDWAKGTRGGKE